MKNFLLTALFTLLSCGLAHAQSTIEVPLKTTNTQIDSLAKELSFTPTQLKDVAKTIHSFENHIISIAKEKTSDVQKKSKVDRLTAQMNKNIKSYLSEDQYTRYLKFRKL